MQAKDYEELLGDLKTAMASDPDASVGILGYTDVGFDIVRYLRSAGEAHRLVGVYGDHEGGGGGPVPLRRLEALGEDRPAVLVVASDEHKEDLLEAAAHFLPRNTRVLLAGYAHFRFRDSIYDLILKESLVPSLANGYPNTLVHLYQCLQNAARLGLDGTVVEFGMFKGGTTLILARLVRALKMSWPVIGFDTFGGFPERRSALDMYAHPGCVFRDESAVRRLAGGENIEVVRGDIVETVDRLADSDIVLAFLDTDNYTSAVAALDVIQERVLVGGAIVFDHFTGRDRFRYTLGERIAGKRLLSDSRFFHLHDTGVFYRQC